MASAVLAVGHLAYPLHRDPEHLGDLVQWLAMLVAELGDRPVDGAA